MDELEKNIEILDDYILGNGGLYKDEDIHKAWEYVKNRIIYLQLDRDHLYNLLSLNLQEKK